MKRFNLETKVGLFFVACFALIAFISLKLGNYDVGEARGYTLSAVFDTAAGLNDETPVLMAGLRVGMVSLIELDRGRARVHFKIKEGTPIPVDSLIQVQSRGFLGAKYLEITPGKSESFYEDSGEITNASLAGELMALSGKAGDIADDVKVITANLRKVFGGEEGEEGIRDIFLNVQDITMRLAGALEDNQETMNRIAENIELFTANLAGMTGENRQALYDAIAVLPAITRHLEAITGNLAKMTDENDEEINDVIRELAASTAQLSIAMEHIASISRKIDEGEGTVGELINDKEAIEQISDTLDSVNEYVGRIRQIQTYLSYRGEYFPDYGDVKSTISLRLKPNPDKWYEIALIDDPIGRTVSTETFTKTTYNMDTDEEYTERKLEEKKVTGDNFKISALIAKRWHFIVFRGGIIESHAGVGTDFLFFDDHLSLSMEASDFSNENNPRLKANMDFMFLDHFFVTAGADDFLHEDILAGEADPRWFMGGGISFQDRDLSMLFTRIPMPDL